MPPGIKPTWWKGKSGLSGRKPKVFEFKKIIQETEERVTNEILGGKARNIASKVLDCIEEEGKVDLETMGRVVVPIVTKDMGNKGMEDAANILFELIDYGKTKEDNKDNDTPQLPAEGIPA